MQVEFRTPRLERCYREHRRAAKAWGADIAERYIERINILKSSRGVEDLYRIEALRFHEFERPARRGVCDLARAAREVDRDVPGRSVVRIEEVTVNHDGD